MRQTLTGRKGHKFCQLEKMDGSIGSMGSIHPNPLYLLASWLLWVEPAPVPSMVPRVPFMRRLVCWRLPTINRAEVFPWRPAATARDEQHRRLTDSGKRATRVRQHPGALTTTDLQGVESWLI